MTKFNRFFVSFLIAGLSAFYSQISSADHDYDPQQSYGIKVGQKAERAFANLGTAWLEIPKNMINVTNQSNVFYGAVGGMFKGLVNMAGRLGVALADLITIPLPTKPIAHPVYIWEDFDVDTTYGDTFRLDPTDYSHQPQPATPMAVPPPAKPAMTPPAGYNDYSPQYNRDNNKKLDRMFQQEMMK